MDEKDTILNLVDEQFAKMHRPVFEYNELDYIMSKCSIIKLHNKDWLICIQTLFNDEEGPFVSLDIYGDLLKNNYQSINIGMDIEKLFEIDEDFRTTEQKLYLTQTLRNLTQNNEFKNAVWLSPAGILKELNLSQNISNYYETEEWEYPDYLSLASDSPSFHSFAQFLTSNKEKMDLGTTNTHWTYWHEYDIEK